MAQRPCLSPPPKRPKTGMTASSTRPFLCLLRAQNFPVNPTGYTNCLILVQIPLLMEPCDACQAVCLLIQLVPVVALCPDEFDRTVPACLFGDGQDRLPY